MRIIVEFCRQDLECASIISSLIKRSQIAFSAAPTAIRTQFAEFPPPVVVTERLPLRTRFVIARELEERKRSGDEECDFQSELEEYAELMSVIQEESTASSDVPTD
jgi:hypothetical protein